MHWPQTPTKKCRQPTNNAERARTFSAGTKRPLHNSIAIKTSPVKQHSESIIGLIRIIPSFYKIQNPGPWPKACWIWVFHLAGRLTVCISSQKGEFMKYWHSRCPPHQNAYSSRNVDGMELAHRAGFLCKFNCLHREEAPAMVSLASSCDQLGLPAQTTAQEGENKNAKLTGNPRGWKWKRPPTRALAVSHKGSLPPGWSLKRKTMLRKKEKGEKKMKTTSHLEKEEIEVFSHPRKVSRACLPNRTSLLYGNPWGMLGWAGHPLINENLFLPSVIHMVDYQSLLSH